jgi:hypothetical protein
MLMRHKIHLVALAVLLGGFCVVLGWLATMPYVPRYVLLLVLVSGAALVGVLRRHRWASVLSSVLFVALLMRSIQYLWLVRHGDVYWDVLPVPSATEMSVMSVLTTVVAAYGIYASVELARWKGAAP